LKPLKVNTSVTVTANGADTKSPATTETITEKTLRDAPNVNERFATLLPLVPGVVRGPDGHINMKGARDTQSGALVNSTNVTDPATGGPAINLPIDVVSSVQVTSNPYDPQYGRFTGAVSSVETKTGNYERYHFSIQNVLPRLRDRGGSIVGIGAERVGGRMALVSNVAVAGRALVAYNLHLESRGNDNLRCSQLEDCFEDADHYKSDTPIIVAGDLNLDASRSVAADLIRQANFHTAFSDQHVRTTPPRSLFDRGQVIDWIVTRGSIKAVSFQVHSSVSASDHYPLSLKMAFK